MMALMHVFDVRQADFTSNPGTKILSFLNSLETYRFKDEDDYEYKSSKNKDSPESFILPFFNRKVSTVTFSEGVIFSK